MSQRSPFIDALKGGLVILMIVYHSCFVAVMFKLAAIDIYAGFWWVFPRVIAAGFVSLAGWNLAGKRARGAGFGGFARRAGFLALISLGISIATWPALGTNFVFFGVIHLVAASTILAYPLLGRPVLALSVGVACLVLGLVLGQYRFDFPWLAWLGFRPKGLYPSDYLPLLPWFAWTAFGAAAGDIAAVIKKHRSALSAGKKKNQNKQPATNKIVGALAVVGKKSLVVYLVHLPLLYGLGWLVTVVLRLP